MLLIMVSELVENTALLSSALYSTFHTEDTVPTDFETACTAIGVFFILGNISTLVYNLLFCLILSHSVTQTLKGSLFSQKRYHLLAIFTISAAVVAISVSNNVGTGFNGICGYKIANR